jgi:chromosome segregation ATPase
MIRESTALVTSMSRLRAVTDTFPSDTAESIAAASLARAADYFKIVHDDFVELATARKAAVVAKETSLQNALDVCAAKTANCEKLEAEVRARAAVLEIRETDVKAREGELSLQQAELDSRSADLPRQIADINSREEGFAKSVESADRSIQERTVALETAEYELDASTKALQAREAEVDGRASSLVSRENTFIEKEANVSTREADLDRRLADLEGREAGLSRERDDLQDREAGLARKLAGLQDGETDVRSRQADLDRRLADLQDRETELARKLAGLQDGEAELARKRAELQKREDEFSVEMRTREDEFSADLQRREDEFSTDLHRRENELTTANEGLERERAEIADERVGVWLARTAAGKDASALEKRKEAFEKAQRDAVGHALAAQALLAQKTDELCVKLAGCSTESIEPHVAAVVKSNATLAETVTGSIQELKDDLGKVALRVGQMEQKAVWSPADLERVRETVDAASQSSATKMDMLQAVVVVAKKGLLDVSAVDAVAKHVTAEADSIKEAIQAGNPGSSIRELAGQIKHLGQDHHDRHAAKVAELRSAVSDLETQLASAREKASRCQGHDTLAADNSELKAKLQSLEATVSELEAQVAQSQQTVASRDESAPTSRKRHRADSADHESEWERVISGVARDMGAIAPVEIVPGRPGPKMIYYELSTMSLKPTFKANWGTFVESGTADAWHCLHRVFSAGHGPISKNGRCESHNQTPCLRVMLRRNGRATETVFTSSS